MKHVGISEPIFYTMFYLVWDCSGEELSTWATEKMRDVEPDTEEIEIVGHAAKYCHIKTEEGWELPIVWIPKWEGTPRDHALLAHELWHMTYHYLTEKGIPATDDTEEVHAYYLGYAMEAALEELNK